MKNTPPHVYRGLGTLLVFAALFVSCEAPLNSGPQRVALEGSSGAASVLYQANEDKSIESLSATVRSYQVSSRPGSDPISESEWRLSTKVIEGRIFVRMDYPAEQTPDLRPRSVLSDGFQSVLFYRDTGEILMRQNGLAPQGIVLPRLTSLSPKVNLDAYLQQAQRLQWEIDTRDPRRLSFTLPVSSRTDSEGVKTVSQRLFFDTDLQVPSGMETVEIDEAGQTQTTTVEMFSATLEGIPLHLGYSRTIEVVGSSLTPENDLRLSPHQDALNMESLEILDETALENLRAEGYSVTPFQADTGGTVERWTEKYIEAYEDIEINTADDLAFRLFF